MQIEPCENRLAQLGSVAVRGFVLDQPDVAGRSKFRILAAETPHDVAVGVGTPKQVVAGRGHDHWAWGNEGTNIRPAPLVIIDPECAVAMDVNCPVNNVLGYVSALATGGNAFHALIRGAEEPGYSAATAEAGDAETPCIDIGARFEVIKGAHSVPDLYAGRGVAAAGPVPAAQGHSAVVIT